MAGSVVGGLLSTIYDRGSPIRIVGLTLFAVGMLSLLLQGGIAFYLDWKSR